METNTIKTESGLEIKTRSQGDALVAQVNGRIDGVSAPEFESTITNMVGADNRALVINFEGVTYISSAGLRAVLLIAKQLGQNNTKIALYALGKMTREVFEISGFDRIIEIHDTEEEALAATT